MVGHPLRWYLSLLALLLALLASWSQSIRESLRHIGGQYWISLPTAIAQPPVAVDVAKDIKYIGSRNANVEHFQNIFYGEDTARRNRFAPPVPVTHDKGSVIDATKPGAWCPQGTGDIFPFSSVITNISENCLSLRIARPVGSNADAKLPVMVWIHGGGHAIGSASDVLYEPDGIVKQAAADGNPLIYVAINYRLGLFGFAASKALSENKHTNAGLRDQRAALEWVCDNIAIFGGDPQKVTIVGQSVGASDIGLQMVAFGGSTNIPFQRAVMISGAPGVNFNTESDLVINNTAAVAQKIGCVKNGDSQSVETLDCLREADFEVVTNLSVHAARAARPPFGEGFFYPTYDGDFLPGRPTELVRAGKIAKGIPILASWVTNEGAWYASSTTATDEDVLATFGLWLTGLSESTKTKLLELYPLDDFVGMVRPNIDGGISPQYYRAAQLNKDLWFTCPVIDFAWQYLKYGGVNTSQVHIYQHNATRFTPVFKYMGVPMWRVSHLSDVPYILNIQQLGGGADNSAAQLGLSKIVTQSIAKVVTLGVLDQISGGIQSWPAAFADVTESELLDEFPSKISLQLLGGPYSTRPLEVCKDESIALKSNAELALTWESLFERCDFINSDKVRREIGV